MKRLLETVKFFLRDERGFLGMLALGAALLGGSLYAQNRQQKAQKEAMKQMQEEAEKNQVKPTIVDNSRAEEARRRKNNSKQGSASTVLAGDYKTSAVKRLLGE